MAPEHKAEAENKVLHCCCMNLTVNLCRATPVCCCIPLSSLSANAFLVHCGAFALVGYGKPLLDDPSPTARLWADLAVR